MRLSFLFLLVVSLLAGAASADDADHLQGTWQIIELEANGEKKPSEEFPGWKLVFEGDQVWVVKPEGADPKLRFRLDSTKSPKTIDLVVQEGNDKGKVAPGIYEFSNGQLRLCINIFGDPSYRPAEFKTRERDGAGFAILERIKSK